MIKLGFYGAAGEVTGSCYVVRTDRASVMVDLGMHQGEKVADEHNRRVPPVDPAKLSAVVLTHAHLDHCGRLPMLARAGYRGRIWCTPATAELTGVVLRDSGKLQEEESERFNAKLRGPGQPAMTPLYTLTDVEKALPLFSGVEYGAAQEVAPGITIRFFDAGHILGSASVQMTVNDGGRSVVLVFSGDVGVAGSPILRDPVTPQEPAPAVVVLESTYGDRDHRPRAETVAELLTVLRETHAAGGKVLIPAFAIGRTQDLIYNMGEFLRAGELTTLNVYVDSPMALETTDLYKRHHDVFDAEALALLGAKQLPLSFPGLTFVQTVEESKRLNAMDGGVVVIAASGMCTGGRIVHHLYHGLPKPGTQVVIVGYQGQGTLGRRLVEGAQSVRIFGDLIPVRAKVRTLGGFSAHAGQSGLLDWFAPVAEQAGNKPRLFLTHGEDGPRMALRTKIKERFGVEVGMPRYGDEVEL